jgi:hypothetical protein
LDGWTRRDASAWVWTNQRKAWAKGHKKEKEKKRRRNAMLQTHGCSKHKKEKYQERKKESLRDTKTKTKQKGVFPKL